jgi:phosphatidylserine synthase
MRDNYFFSGLPIKAAHFLYKLLVMKCCHLWQELIGQQDLVIPQADQAGPY